MEIKIVEKNGSEYIMISVDRTEKFNTVHYVLMTALENVEDMFAEYARKKKLPINDDNILNSELTELYENAMFDDVCSSNGEMTINLN